MFPVITARFVLLTTLLVIINIYSIDARAYNLACDPRTAHKLCLEGCLTCFDSYGGAFYDTAACCKDCKDFKANLIDYGPSKCSNKYIKSSWLKRFG